MAYCLKCGAYIPDGQTACLACGYDALAEQKKAEKAKQAEPKAQPAKEEKKPEQIPLEGAEKDRARVERLRTIEELLGRGNKK